MRKPFAKGLKKKKSFVKLLRFLWNFINIIITKYFIRASNYFLFNFNYFWNFITVRARVCVCIIYKNNIDESVTQETFHEAKVLSFELQSDDYKIEKKPENSSSPSTWLNTFVLVRDADALHYDSTISRFVFPFHGEKKRGRGGDSSFGRKPTQNSLVTKWITRFHETHLRERYKRFILGNKKGS